MLEELKLPDSWIAAEKESHWIGHTSALTTATQGLGEEIRTREKSTRESRETLFMSLHKKCRVGFWEVILLVGTP